MPSPQYRYWLLTIPHHEFLPYQPQGISFIGGQLETGSSTGYLHWQLLVHFHRPVSLAHVRKVFGRAAHCEPSRSDAARAYVFKTDTRVSGTQFQLGSLPFRRNVGRDWDDILSRAKSGSFDGIPSDVVVRNYGSLKRIAADHMVADGIEKEVFVYWGKTATGKSRRAWEEAGRDAFPKDPRSKWWCGYRDQEHVVIDEFRGDIGINHFLRWLDRYPVVVEVKGGAVPLKAKKIWITSNLDPRSWYPDLDSDTFDAMMRRLKITHFNPPLM